MELLPVHIAVLTIAEDAANADRATAQAITERATDAGHSVVDEEIAKDNEAAIRDQLVRWIAEPNIDVVIVAASIDSEAASAALAPLVMQTLPGFTDLFRWLTFQEIGASAMQSAAEAAQCESTFVFVLPAHEVAVRAAMDKLILPQLDVRTKPKNLVAQMPRLKDEAKRLQTALQAVPTPIASEKTVGGSGVAPKPPARPKTRTANTIARKHDDPPTKPIDLAKLEKQIALSNQNDAHTKQVDLGAHQAQTKVVDMSAHHAETKVVDMSAHQAKTRVVDLSGRLPRVPPGADEDFPDDETDALTFDTPPPPAHPPLGYRTAAPIGVVKTASPLPSIPRPRAPSEGGAASSPAPWQTKPAPAAPVQKSTPAPLAKPPPALSTPSFSTPISRSTRATGRQPVVSTPSTAATPPGGTATPPSGLSTSGTAPPPSGLSTSDTATPPSGLSTSGTAPPPSGAPTNRRPGTAPLGAPPVIISPRNAKRSSGSATPASSSAIAPSSPTTPPSGTTTSAPGASAAASPAASATAAAAASATATAAAAATASAAASATATAAASAPAPAAAPPPAAAPAAAPAPVSVTGPAPVAAPASAADAAGAREAVSVTNAEEPAVTTAASTASAASAASSLDGIARLSDSQIEMLPDDALETDDASSAPRTTPPVPTPPPARKPTQPPPVDPLAGLTSRPLANVDLPEGDFVYPIKKSGAGLLLKLLLAAAVLALGFFAFVELYPRAKPAQTAAVTPEPAETGNAASAQPEVVEPEATPPDRQPSPDEPAPAEPAASTEPPAAVPGESADRTEPARSRESTTTSTKPATRPSRRSPPTTSDKPTTTATTKPTPEETTPRATAETGPVPASDDCDEVSCVMTKYDRPCCERFRPADSFRPRTQIPDELDRQMVKAGVETVKPKIVSCGERNGTKGTVKVAVAVADIGTVKKVTVVESPDTALGECVAEAMRNARFGKSARGGEFVYPFVF